MDLEEFKENVKNIFISHGFRKKNNNYYKENDELFCAIGLQKSSFSEAYYINIGYVIKAIESMNSYPKYTDGHFRSRFLLVKDGKTTDTYEYKSIDYDRLEKSITANINNNIDFALSNGINKLLEKEPALINLATIKVKKYLKL